MPRGIYRRNKKTPTLIQQAIEENFKDPIFEEYEHANQLLEYQISGYKEEIIRLKDELLRCYRKLSPGC